MRIPMPSPRGSNLARLFLNSAPAAAYDEATPAGLTEEAKVDLLAFLTDKLSEADLAEFCKMAGIDQGMTMDDGLPRPGGKFAEDARRRMFSSASEIDFARRHPHAAKIAVNR